MDEDEDAFLYGDSEVPEPLSTVSEPPPESESGHHDLPLEIANGDEEEEEEEEEEEDSESDVEIIMDSVQVPRSRDFRTNQAPRGSASRTLSGTQTRPVHLTTEYTPRERGAPPTSHAAPPAPSAAAETPPIRTSSPVPLTTTPDTPPVTTLTVAPSLGEIDARPITSSSTAPIIDPTAPGMFSGIPIYDIEIQALSEKNWRRPGSDISDWFNYGFDEISWEAYCVRRRELSGLSADLKTNVLNLAGMSEEMLTNSVPPEMRSMLIAQSARMGVQQQMSFPSQFGLPQQQSGFPMQMMNPGMNMTPDMMAMGMAQHMGMGNGMGVGVSGGMGIGDGSGSQGQNAMGGPGGSSGIPQQQQPGIGDDASQIQGLESFVNPAQQFIQPMGMNAGGGDFSGMQDAGSMQQQPGFVVDTPPVVAPPTGPMRGRGRGIPPSRPFGGGVPLGPAASRASGAATPMAMGRGRYAGDGTPQLLPKRPASPLPPNVPTGPRNQQARYKDRDGGAAQVDGLDYGGGGGGNGSVVGTEERDRDERKRDKTPPSGPRKSPPVGPRKDKEKEERRAREERRPSREDRHEDKGSRKRTHSEDYEYERDSRSSKRR